MIRLKLCVTYPGLFVIKDQVADFFPFDPERDPKKAAKALLKIRKGEKIGVLDQLLETFEGGKLLLGSKLLLSTLREHYPETNFQVLTDWEKLNEIRSAVSELLEEVFDNREEYVLFVNKVSRVIAREKVSKAGEKRDLIISETITIIEELEKMVNNLVSHLKDFYGYYFPELADIVKDNEIYLKITTIGKKEDMTKERLENITNDQELIRKLLREKEISLKARFKDSTIHMVQEIAQKALALSSLRRFLLNRLEQLMKEEAPNITAIIGSKIGAKLIKEIGGLKKMAESPSSTIQVIGAEKALFRALRGKGSPPKHGIIFQDPRIHNAPEDQRGKIARAIANKLAIAARVDYFGERKISERLNRELGERIKEIKRGG